MADSASMRIIPRLDLAFDQPLERPRNLPFLIALSARWQRAGLSYYLHADLGQPPDIEKLCMSCHDRSLGQAGSITLSVTADAVMIRR